LQAVGAEDQVLAASVIDAKSHVRELERTVIDSNSGDAPRLVRPSALERELAESLRRSYSLVRRFVRVGTGLHRTGMGDATARGSLRS
jgi:hypothetical protein